MPAATNVSNGRAAGVRKPYTFFDRASPLPLTAAFLPIPAAQEGCRLRSGATFPSRDELGRPRSVGSILNARRGKSRIRRCACGKAVVKPCKLAIKYVRVASTSTHIKPCTVQLLHVCPPRPVESGNTPSTRSCLFQLQTGAVAVLPLQWRHGAIENKPSHW